MHSSFLLYSYLLLYLLLSPNFYSPLLISSDLFLYLFLPSRLLLSLNFSSPLLISSDLFLFLFLLSRLLSPDFSWFLLCSFFLIYLLLMSPFFSFLYSLLISTLLWSFLLIYLLLLSPVISSLFISFSSAISLFLCLFLICSFIFPLYPLLLFLLSSGLLSPSFFPASFQSFLQSEALEFFCTHCHKQISRLEDLSTRLQLLEMNR